MAGSERQRELRRRRHRKQKVAKLQKKLKAGSAGDKGLVAEKLRQLTPGAEDIIRRWGLADQ
jgi:hypothetical protein